MSENLTQHTNDAYVKGFQAARREGPYAEPDADRRCPYMTETEEAKDWQRGYDDACRAQDASG
jgi:hypothetical protein